MKRMILAGLAALGLALAACGQQQQAPTSGEETPAAQAPTLNTNIGPDGAAGISTALSMDVASVRAAAPLYDVALVEDQVEGEPFMAITLSSAGEEIFRALPTADGRHIHSIVTRATQAHSPTQEVVGAARFAVAPPEQVEFCGAELVDGSPGFACSTAEDGNFWRVYKAPEGYDGPSDPFDAIDPDVLHDSVLVEMRWIAPRV
ncbi:hypothetical protein [Vitreimonas flagellata]|uniref:hypothetical protein n=1 Tax=Vitreimonas flagellata TaxID=2560861 RepID=UPI00107536A9|nr:hypothetical protein [Vitreimonas flagellata]